MCNTYGDIIRLNWGDNRPLWTTLYQGAQRSPWSCDRVQDGDMAWWIFEYHEIIKDVEGKEGTISSTICKQDSSNNGVITLHYIVSMRTSKLNLVYYYIFNDVCINNGNGIYIVKENNTVVESKRLKCQQLLDAIKINWWR